MTKTIYRVFYSFLSVLTVSFFFSRMIMMGEMNLFKIILCFVTVSVFWLINNAPKSIKIAIPVIAFIIVVAFDLLGGSDIKLWFIGYVKAVLLGKKPSDDLLASYEVIQTVVVSVLSCVYVTVFEKINPIKYLTALVLLLYMCVELFTGAQPELMGVVTTLTFIICAWVEWIQSTWNKRRSEDYAGYLVWLLPFILIMTLILSILPYSDAPYSWKYTKQAYNKLTEKFTVFSKNVFQGNREDFDQVMAGFSDANSFFGNIQGNDKPIMTVEGNNMLVTNVYLIGRSYDTFNGRGWEQIVSDTSKDRIIDTLETQYAIKCYDGDNMQSYISTAALKIKYEDYRSQYEFLPLKVTKYESKGRRRELYSDENLLINNKNGYGHEYSVSFYQLNVDHAVFYEMLENTYEDDKKNWVIVRGANADSAFGLESKKEHSRLIQSEYSDDIQLSEDMKEWVAEKTDGALTPVQRIKMLELALSEMEYTKSPGDLPEYVNDASEFLDYFILKNKKGYCTYYATALTLLARSEGFPARYVEGFCVPVKNKKATVTNNMAHAWPEIYFEGVGWIPFEPTPGYDIYRYTPWEIKVDETVSDIDVNARYWEKQANIIPEKMQELPVEEPVKSKLDLSFIWLFLKISGIVIVCITVVLCIDRLVRYYIYSRLTLEKKYVFNFNRNMKMLGYLDLSLKPGETIEEFSVRLNEAKSLWEDNTDYRFLSEYEAFRYGGKVVNEEMLNNVVIEQLRIRKDVRNKSFRLYLVSMFSYYFL